MSEADSVSSRKKTKDRIQQLSELRRGLVHYTDAQYGTTSDPIFVMHMNIDGMVFQGVGPSKKRAKVMASERALAYLGEIEANVVQLPAMETPQVDDHTADVFTGLLYSDFETPDVSATDANLKLLCYQPEGVDVYDEYDTYSAQEAFQGYVGRNAVSIMSEIRPDAMYELLFASTTNPTRFVTSVRVKGRSYCGDAKNKKVSKGRAAAMALTDIYGIEFGTAEDGMPVYEGSTKVWESYKADLEKEVEMQTAPVTVVNPVEQLNEMFPEAEFEFPDADAKSGGFFRARFTVAGITYEGVGLSKRDAKANAAANTVEALEKSGLLAERRAEIEAKRKEREQRLLDKGDTDKGKQTQKSDSANLSRHPNVKLQEVCPQAVYHDVGETPLRNTSIRAFIAAVVIRDQTFVGIGRSKKLAKTAAAEKCLRALGHWTEEDESAKKNRLKADRSTVIPPLMGVEGFDPMLPDGEVQSLIGSFAGRSRRGRDHRNVGFGSRGYQQRGRGRGFARGYGGHEWYGDAMGDTFGGDSEALNMMVGELSQLVGQILETNPNLGVEDVWNMLQQNPDYQSWRCGAVASNMQSYYQNYDDPYASEYYGPSGYSDDWYYYQPSGMNRGQGVNVRRWSRSTPGSRGRHGGKNRFQNSASYW